MAVRNGSQYLRKASCAGFALLLLSTVALCADYSVSGRVLDPKGNPIPGAMIRLIQQQYGLELRGKTDEQGRFEFSVSAVGAYKIQADVTGFQPVEKIISVSSERKIFNIEMQKLATRNEFTSVTAKIEETSINSPDPGERIVIRQETLEANPGRPGAPVSIPGIPIETASGGIKAPQYFVPGVAGDHGEPIAQYILVGSYLAPNNLSANAHGNGYADPNIFIAPTIASVQVDAGAFNVLEGNHSVNLAAAYGLQPKISPFLVLNADYRDLDVAAGFSPSAPESHSWIAFEASYGNGLLDRLEHRQQYKVNAFRAYELGTHELTLFGIGYYGFSYIPGLTPLNQPELHETIDPRQKDQTHTAEIAANDIWNMGSSRQLQFSGIFRTYNLALYSNFGDGLIRQSEFRTVAGGNGTYIQRLGENISLLAGVDYARDAPRRLDLDRYQSTDPNYYGPFQSVTANNITINDLAPYAAIKGALTKHIRYYAGFRHDEIGFNNIDLLTASNSFNHWVPVNSPKASISLIPTSGSWLPTASLSFGKAFFTNDPRIGTGTVQGTLVEHARSYQVIVDKLAGMTDLRLTLGHVTTDASLAKIDPDTGLQENEGPGRLRFLTAMVRHRFSFGMFESSFSKADARDVLSGDPTPEAPRLIFDFLGTLDRLPFSLHAKSEFEYVGKKPLSDGFVGAPVKEFRAAMIRNFRNQKLDLGLNLLIASGYAGQTTEVLAAPGDNDPMETVVGVRVPSYVGISASYHF